MTVARAFPFRLPQPSARVRLFCFPFAGGAATIYRSWSALLAPKIDVCAFEMPGKGARMGEPAHGSLTSLVDEAVRVITPLQDRPVALFGHSMGALVAFEVARRLEPNVAHLFVSAAPAPDIERRRRSHQSDAELTRELRDLGGTAPEILENAEIMALALPVLRRDFALVEPYRAEPGLTIATPITAFAGAVDKTVAVEEVERWTHATRSGFQLEVVHGAHFFLESHRAALLAAVERVLAPAMV